MSILLNPLFEWDKIEYAKSDRSSCWSCLRNIGKGVPRGIIFSKKGTNWRRSICRRCLPSFLDEEIKILKKNLTTYKRLKSRFNRMVVKSSKEIEVEEMGKIAKEI